MLSDDQIRQLCGWVPPHERSVEQNEIHERIVASMPPLPTELLYREEPGARVSLWKAADKVLGRPHKFNHQLTGSCVGAGGGNMAKVLQCIEIAAGDLEEYREIWWLFTYGRSRFRAGMRTPGEGSTGSGWAEAATKDGFLAQDERPGLPEFREVDGWLQVSSSIERSWSDGDAQQSLDLLELSRTHLIKTAAQCRSSADARAALINGYPITLASMFGTSGIRQRGEPAVNIADWNGSWAHQMFCDEFWDHPTLGPIFRIGNNWGPRAHPAPTQGEPPGGFYILDSTMDRICKSEVFAFSFFAGFPSRVIPWIFG